MKLFGKKNDKHKQTASTNANQGKYHQNDTGDKNKALLNAMANSGQDLVVATFLKNLANSDSQDLISLVAGGIRESQSPVKPLPHGKKGLIGRNFQEWDPSLTDKKCYNCGGNMNQSNVYKSNEQGMRFICKSCGYFVLTALDESHPESFGTVIKEGIMDFSKF